MTAKPTTVEEYLAGFSPEVRTFLEEVLEAIRRGMPTLMLEGRYGLRVAGWKAHAGLYPVPDLSADDPELEAEVALYRTHKDTVRLRYRDPVPADLVERLAIAVARRR